MLSVAASGLTLAALGVIYKSWRAQASTYLYLGLVVWLFSSVLVLCSGVGVWRAICAVYPFHFSVAFYCV